VKKKNQHPLLA